ncbi:Zinc finger, RING/FYVE/PHD-type [Plasmopara halstedii]|uniref:Zinc finger, RING/FYVE/PHD-type n=1 Tax=Plasmopara halstedii TaxID=4781 RepID=A0A0P1AZJ5_PLAHL|nr:Zinc finger, RING/FYVE/PHD-type [Plasmopara halstedii]CEG47246.1 Zinc finger, RING/FYVE/PHD-type [Plasmopara halstedii]|eukprot:XP_024583615.1 Zinc finger, RING/FYVE/PHD-type [Plasmopara halstedii]
MARGALGVTCLECGCLNFSSTHEKCDQCRSKVVTFRPTVRRLSSSSGIINDQNRKSPVTRVTSPSKKRRYNQIKHDSRKESVVKSTQEKKKNVKVAIKLPDVIDLISDDEIDDNKVHQVADNKVHQVAEVSVKIVKQDKKEQKADDTEDTQLIESRVFPIVTFVEHDFPSVGEGMQMRKKTIKQTPSLMTLMDQKVRTTIGQEKVSKSILRSSVAESRLSNVTGDQKSIESRHSPMILDVQNVEAKVQTLGLTATALNYDGRNNNGTNFLLRDSNLKLATNVASTSAKDKETDHTDLSKLDLFFQSRVFDTVEFKVSDFRTVFHGLALARRSHPKPPSSDVSLSRHVKPAACSTVNSVIVEAEAMTNDVEVPFTESSIPSISTANGDSIAASVENPASKIFTPTAETATNTLASACHATTLELFSTAVQSLSATISSEPEAAIVPLQPFKASNTQSPPDTSTLLTPLKKTLSPNIASSPKQTSSPPGMTKSAELAQNEVSASVPPKSVLPTNELTTKTGSRPVRSVGINFISSSDARKDSSGSQTKANPSLIIAKRRRIGDEQQRRVAENRTSQISSIEAKTLGDTNSVSESHRAANPTVLVAKKRRVANVLQQRGFEKQLLQFPVSKTLAEPDSIGVVKDHASALKTLPVEPPVLGYCRPEFLAFMRVCGDVGADEEVNFEKSSRSQLRLLDVVDLTHLSDSDDSDELPNHRHEINSNSLLNIDDAINLTSNGSVSDSKKSYVPAIESERKRTQPERAICELCEEKVARYRLIQCPKCTKFYHLKCAKDNGDENVCWNCELGSLIDDSELDEEHAKHTSEYLTYLKALRNQSPPGTEDESDDDSEQGEDDINVANISEEEKVSTVADGNNAKTAGKIWMEFLGDVTADVDASFHEITNRIAEELRDKDKKSLYSRGFVSREEFEAQMNEVENYYIGEEARLQQLEREKALEAKKVIEARIVQAEVELANGGQQLAITENIDSNAPTVPAAGDQNGSNTNMIPLPGNDVINFTSAPSTASFSVLSQAVVPTASPASAPAVSTVPTSVPTVPTVPTVAQPATCKISSTRLAPPISTP